jgi:hypothetical protein
MGGRDVCLLLSDVVDRASCGLLGLTGIRRIALDSVAERTMKLGDSFSGALRTFAYFMASGTMDTLRGVEYLTVYGSEPSAIEQVFAIYANVIELDDEGLVINAKSLWRHLLSSPSTSGLDHPDIAFGSKAKTTPHRRNATRPDGSTPTGGGCLSSLSPDRAEQQPPAGGG